MRFRWDIYSIHCHTFEAFTSHYQDYQDWPTGLYHRMIYWLQSVFFVLHCAAIKWITQLAAGQIYENCFIIISMKSYSQLTLAQVKKACWYILFKVGVCAINPFDQKLQKTENFYFATIFKAKHPMSSDISIFFHRRIRVSENSSFSLET